MDAQSLYTAYRLPYDVMTRLVGHQGALTRYLGDAALVQPHSKILDAGCGSGAVSKAVLAVAQQQNITDLGLYGFDLTPAMLDEFKRWLGEHLPAKPVELAQANVLELGSALPAAWNNFDLILSSGMLEYVPKDKLVVALQNLRSLLSPTGTMVVFISQKHLFNRLVIELIWQANTYTKAEVEKYFSEAGLHIAHLEPFRTWGWVVTTKTQ